MRARSFLLLAAISAVGCTIGEGSGKANGPLWIEGCQDGKPWPSVPELFKLEPTFFAGEPIEDISDGAPANRLIIRMQRTGNEVQISDTLFFDIPNSGLVARCLRGRTVGGVPDWDTTSTGSPDPNVTTPWCEPMGPNGTPRIHLVPFGPVRAALTPLATCHSEAHQPAVVGVTGVAKDGWIDFLQFGSAEEPDKAPEARKEITDFQVAFDAPLAANFLIVLDDDRVQTALYKQIDVPPDPRIGGVLWGDFEFEMKRGRAAQTFP